MSSFAYWHSEGMHRRKSSWFKIIWDTYKRLQMNCIKAWGWATVSLASTTMI